MLLDKMLLHHHLSPPPPHHQLCHQNNHAIQAKGRPDARHQGLRRLWTPSPRPFAVTRVRKFFYSCREYNKHIKKGCLQWCSKQYRHLHLQWAPLLPLTLHRPTPGISRCHNLHHQHSPFPRFNTFIATQSLFHPGGQGTWMWMTLQRPWPPLGQCRSRGCFERLTNV